MTSRRSLPYSSSVFSSAIVRGMLKERIIIGKNVRWKVRLDGNMIIYGWSLHRRYTIIPLAWCDRPRYTDERLSHDPDSRSRYNCAGKRNGRRNYMNKITRILVLNHVVPEALSRRCISFKKFRWTLGYRTCFKRFIILIK